MNVFVLNPGSSSLKFALYHDETLAASGKIEEIKAGEFPRATAGAIRRMEGRTIGAVGCRVVHGGSKFISPARIDDPVIQDIRDLVELAPLHNPLALEVIDEVRRTIDAPIVAVFDTAFHQTLPPVASTYAIPPDLGIRRYGFHGISYAYIASRLRRPRMIVCHLGNGASVCAMRDGRSVDTSMGFTPMEGLVMGSRAGDIDPGAILHLVRGGRSEAELDDLLNHRSGLRGVSGIGADVRELESSSDERARLALDLFAYRVAKYIGAYAVVLGGIDALVFTAGIGEHSATTRRRICDRLGLLGIELDDALNVAARTDERRISSGPVEVWVIPTNEELEIARATMRTLV